MNKTQTVWSAGSGRKPQAGMEEQVEEVGKKEQEKIEGRRREEERVLHYGKREKDLEL